MSVVVTETDVRKPIKTRAKEGVLVFTGGVPSFGQP
jgi:hypothetical protein